MKRRTVPGWRAVTAGAVVTLAACAGGGDPQEPADSALLVREDGVEYTADTAVMESFPVQLATTVTATNRSGRSARLTFPDGCVVLLRAYHDEARSRLAWSQQDHVHCTAALVEWTLPAGASRQGSARTDAAEILRDTLPDGRYWLEAVLRPNGTTIAVPAGTVDLAVPRD